MTYTVAPKDFWDMLQNYYLSYKLPLKILFVTPIVCAFRSGESEFFSSVILFVMIKEMHDTAMLIFK